MKYITSFFAFIVPIFMSSQINYVYEGYSSINKIHRINPDNTTTLALSIPNNYSFTDIAISPSGIFYGVSQNIYEININTGEIAIIYAPGISGGYLSLVCSADYKLYTINEENYNLYQYDIDNDSFEFVHNLGVGTDGDITFYKGYLIFPSGDKIKALDLESNTLTDIYCLPSDSYGIWGMSNIATDCSSTKNVVYSISSIGEEYCSYDLENKLRTCVDISHEFDSNILGMASDNECLLSNCKAVQLSVVDCSPLSTVEIEWIEKTLIAPSPFSDEIEIIGGIEVESLEIFDSNGKRIMFINKPESSINTNALKSGMYFIQLNSKLGSKTEKVLKK